MNNVSDIYTLWLKPWHLPLDKPCSVTIQKAEVRTIHPRPTEEKKAIILTFAGKNRKLILNATNANAMTDIGGEDWAAWQGLVIQLKRHKFTKDKETIIICPASITEAPLVVKETIEPTKQDQPGSNGAEVVRSHWSADQARRDKIASNVAKIGATMEMFFDIHGLAGWEDFTRYEGEPADAWTYFKEKWQAKNGAPQPA